jgi:hypothetical protein
MANVYDNDDVAPQPKPFPPEMVEDLESKTVGHEVRDYLWGRGPLSYENTSAQMKRELVLKFVEFEISDLPPNYFWRVRVLADFYNLNEILKTIQGMLDKLESEPILLDRSIAGTIMLEEIGDEGQKKTAAQYYDYLISHRFANEKFAELIECLATFGNEVNPQPLLSRIEQEVKSLAAREAGEPEAGTEKRYIEGLADNEFFIIEEANKARARVSNIGSTDERLFELIKAYLHLTEDDGGDYFFLWTHQQIRRIAETEGNEKVIEAFRLTVSKLDKMPAADKNFCKVRSLNAIEFFGGKLKADEAEFMNKNRQKQIDVLRFIDVPYHIEDPVEEEEIEDEETVEEEEKNEG